VTNAENVYSIKRFIGRRWNTEAERHRVPYYCVRGRDTVDVQIRGRTYTPQEISAMLLQNLNRMLLRRNRKSSSDYAAPANNGSMLVRLPDYAAHHQRTNRCSRLQLDRINEQRILVFDLGGGTFDVSILQLGRECSKPPHLGGDDFDNCIVQWMISLPRTRKIDLS